MCRFYDDRWNYDIKYFYSKQHPDKFPIIKAGNWYLNRNTPVGEDAELIERKPYNGYRILDIRKSERLKK